MQVAPDAKGRAMEAPLQERQVRAAKNQALFREVNERIETIGASVNDEIGYVCECLNLECGAQLHLSLQEYEAVRQGGSARFLVKPGHLYSDVERIVAEHSHYVVVEKIEVGAEVAALLDQRTQDAEL